jgi:hypothetical protein
MGIPLSVAQGLRAPADGWTDLDWLLAQAWGDVERMTCSECNTPLWQALDPALRDRWVADLPIRCHPCTVVAQVAEQYADTTAPRALRFPVRLASQ